MWMFKQRRSFIAVTAATLAGCGFALRRAPELRFQTLQLSGFAKGSTLADELRDNINASATTRVLDTAAAQVVLQALNDAREKVVVATNSVGQVTEFELRVKFSFQLRRASGAELISRADFALKRDMSYTESAALGKEQEEAALYKTMQSDVVAQVMRRLAAVQWS
jgi:LPS-assembly lipoprotein